MVTLMMPFHADKNTKSKMATIESALYSLFCKAFEAAVAMWIVANKMRW